MAKKRIQLDRKAVVEAIQKAAKELGRPPHRGELPRVARISHSVVLKHFATLRDAVRTAGLEPSRQGLKVAAEELLKDFARVAEKLGHAPNRNEYVKHGKYAAGTFYGKFGSWPGVKRAASNWQLATGQQSGDRVIGRSGDLKEADSAPDRPHEGDKAIAMQWAGAMTALPGELAGKRRVTDAVCAMIVNTLIGADNDWQGKLGRYLGPGEQTFTADQRGLARIEAGETRNSGSATLARVNGDGVASPTLLNESVTSGGILNGELPVMGPPLYKCALSNAPANEMGVMILFGMLAGELGFQIEAVQGKYPDIHAKRQIQPGRWQWVRIEVEYESRNFALHGHDPEKCDIIVCWRHNWAKCPKHIEVIELSKIVGAW